jgi:hypothetical protein
VFEEGSFDIPELARLSKDSKSVSNGSNSVEIQAYDDGYWVPVVRGKVVCKEFPFVILTSNGERDFPPAFMRRCLRVTIPEPTPDRLAAIVDAHLGEMASPKQMTEWETLIGNFEVRRRTHELATDQLLNALYLRLTGTPLGVQNIEEGQRLEGQGLESQRLLDALLKPLTGGQAT